MYGMITVAYRASILWLRYVHRVGKEVSRMRHNQNDIVLC